MVVDDAATILAYRSRTGKRRVHFINLLSESSSARLVGDTCPMSPSLTNRYKNHRFPAEIISHAVWLYFRFCLRYRDVEELLYVRGVIVSYEAIRQWCRKFGRQYANQLRLQRPGPGAKWQLDEGFLTINGERHYLWRAVDQHGRVLDILVQRAGTRPLRKNSSASCSRSLRTSHESSSLIG
jgi:hypothetical protein